MARVSDVACTALKQIQERLGKTLGAQRYAGLGPLLLETPSFGGVDDGALPVRHPAPSGTRRSDLVDAQEPARWKLRRR